MLLINSQHRVTVEGLSGLIDRGYCRGSGGQPDGTGQGLGNGCLREPAPASAGLIYSWGVGSLLFILVLSFLAWRWVLCKWMRGLRELPNVLVMANPTTPPLFPVFTSKREKLDQGLPTRFPTFRGKSTGISATHYTHLPSYLLFMSLGTFSIETDLATPFLWFLR